MAQLKNKTFNTVKEQELYMADMPVMTERGTFIINGIERVVVPQLARSYGVYFTANEVRAKRYFGAKIIPERGAWIEIETEAGDAMTVKIDKNRKFPITTLLRVLGAGENDDI